MHSGETIGTEQLAGVTSADVLRWLFAIGIVGMIAAGGSLLARDWTPPAGDVAAIQPAILLELEPVIEPEPQVAPEPQVEPEPEVVPEPMPELAQPTPPEPDAVQPPELEPDPLPPPEPAAEPLLPEPVASPPRPEPAAEPPPVEPPPPPEPEPEPLPEIAAPAIAMPMPVSMSAELAQQRQQTPATNPQRPRPTPKPAPEPQAPQAEAPKPQPAAPQAQPAAAAGPSPQQWQQQVIRHIDRRKVYPRDAQRAGQEGVVAISFSIDASGRILSVSVARSSGIPALDQAALETARRASPVPKPPASMGQGTLSLTASIRFTLR